MAELLLVLHDQNTTAGTTIEWCRSRQVDHEIVIAPEADFAALEGRGAIVFGGDMQVWEEAENPWLVKEKDFIRRFVESERRVLGICLGSQLLAEQLGGTVHPMPEAEVGWYPVTVGERALTPLHWHESYFTLPSSCQRLARNDFCENQGFSLSPKVLGFQFHTEIDPARLERALSGWNESLQGRVQKPDEIASQARSSMPLLAEWYFSVLDHWWA